MLVFDNLWGVSKKLANRVTCTQFKQSEYGPTVAVG